MSSNNRTTIDTIVPAALKASLAAFVAGSRQSGRTASRLKTAMHYLAEHTGRQATYICASESVRRYAMRLWVDCVRETWPEDEAGLVRDRLNFVVVEPKRYAIIEAYQGHIRLPAESYFDHSWLEQYYQNAIDESLADLVGAVLAFKRDEEPVRSAELRL